MGSKTLIRESLFFLNGSGLHPFIQNPWSKIRTFVTATIFGSLLTEHIMDIIFHWKGLNSMQAIAATVTVQLGIHRLINLIINRKKFAELLTRIENFGTSTNSKDFIHIYTELQTSYTYTGRKIIASAVVFMLTSTTLVFLIPVAFEIKWITLPIYHYTTESPYFEITNVFLFFASSIMSLSVLLPNEFLFASLLTHLLCELKVLKEEIETTALCIDGKASLRCIREFVEHHNLVLGCINNMSEIYSGLFLNQFLATTVGLCACLVTVIGGSLTDWTYLFSFFTISVIYLGQLFVYCLGGTLLIKECEEISVAAYNSLWWKKPESEFRNALLLVIQRAQKANVLTAGGIVPLNVESFASVIKTAYSFYSVVKSIYND